MEDGDRTDGSVRVMVVDDHRGNRALVRDVVSRTKGFVAIGSAASGEEALSRLERRPADLVLMDVRMPGAGGVAAARKAAKLARRPLVVLFSGDDHPEIEAHLPEHGAIAFVRKDRLCPRELERLWREHAQFA